MDINASDVAISGDKALAAPPNITPGTEIHGTRLSNNDAGRKYCRDKTVAMIKKTDTGPAKSMKMALHAVFTPIINLWPVDSQSPANICYGFVPGDHGGTDLQRRKVTTTIEEWTHFGNFTFDLVNDVTKNTTGVRIAFDPARTAGSWSLVGVDCASISAPEPTMNLGWISEGSEATDSERATILHEFGHVLGMLHEHQSPAGGGVTLVQTPAALKYYEETQDWDAATVRAQVLDHYNKRDVSSFSRVDLLSIMQYPLPAQVTGFDYNMEYNTTLSEMDKAYMGVMYPRANAHSSEPLWTFEYALAKTGIVRESPDCASKIMAVYNKEKSTGKKSVDPTKIRNLFATWCQEVHEGKVGGSRKGGDVVRGIKPDAAGKDTCKTYVITAPHTTMCSVGDDRLKKSKATRKTPAGSGQDRKLRAVIGRDWLGRDELPKLKSGDKDFVSTITWSIVTDDYHKRGESYPEGSYHKNLVQNCLKEWSEHASIQFVPWEGVTSAKEANIMIYFQRYRLNYSSDPPELPVWGDPLYGARQGEKCYTKPSKDSEDPIDEICSKVRHNICIRAACETIEEAQEYSLVKAWDAACERSIRLTREDLDRRAVLHEVGHFLGLDHEIVGPYGYCVYNAEVPGLDTISEEAKKEIECKINKLRSRYAATKFDSGSIMDVLQTHKELEETWENIGEKGQAENNVRLHSRTVFDLSPYDQANIALLHPGSKLHDENIIEKHVATLKLDDSIVVELKQYAQFGEWVAFRNTYIQSLDNQVDEISEDLFEFARKASNRLHSPSHLKAPKPGPALRGVGPSSDGLLYKLYEQLKKHFGPTGSQMLTLQSPTRYLAKEEFQFELAGIYSNFVKPTPVAEAEFRLTDALYDAAQIVSAPNGKSLSVVYDQILNNFVPRYEETDRKVRHERERIRSWLLTEVGNQDPYYKFDYNSAGGGKGDNPDILNALNSSLTAKNSFVRKMSRMEFASQLSQDYYTAQMKWELDRDAMIGKAIQTNDPQALATLTRTLAHTSQSAQGKLTMQYANSVVRGYSHIVREALGHLDVKTPAEFLQDAKDAFRSSAVSSLYGASRVYPVLMSPVDWSEALDTGFSLEDLAENPDMLMMTIKTKSSKLDTLKQQLSLLIGSAEGDVTTLRTAMEKKAEVVQAKEAALREKYKDSTIELAKIVAAFATDGMSEMTDIAAQDVGTRDAITAANTSKTNAEEQLKQSLKQANINEVIEKIVTQVAAVSDAQRELDGATRAWSSKVVSLARAQATDSRVQQSFLESQIASLSSQLDDLRARYTVSIQARTANIARVQRLEKANNGHGTVSIASLSQNRPKAVGVGSRWQEVHLTHEQVYTKQSSEVSASTSNTSWNVGFWVWSTGGSTSSTSANFWTKNENKQIHIEIHMKISLVTVDRSSWFQPQLFDNTTQYMRNNDKTKFNVPPPEVSLLPSYPVGYIICKDVYMELSGFDISTAESKQHLNEQFQASGGCLFFSFNTSSESSRDSSSASVEMASDGMIIRIPGPQILGYVQQVMPKDETKPYDPALSLGTEFYLPPQASPTLGQNEEDPKGVRGNSAGAAHGIKLSGRDEDGGPKMNFDYKAGPMAMPNVDLPQGPRNSGATVNPVVSKDDAAKKKNQEEDSAPGHRDTTGGKRQNAALPNGTSPPANNPDTEGAVGIDKDKIAEEALSRILTDAAFRNKIRKALGL